MKNVIETWAPWMDTAESYELVENVLQKPEYLRKVKAADLGARLNLTWEERHELSIRTIAPADLTPEQFEDRRRERRRAKQRAQKERSRRKAGVKSRIVRRATSLTHLRPWAALNMSRATWYRRRRSETAGETDVSSHKLLDIRETDVSQSVVVESQLGIRGRKSAG